jgi:hypothetical protein
VTIVALRQGTGDGVEKYVEVYRNRVTLACGHSLVGGLGAFWWAAVRVVATFSTALPEK